MLFITPPGSWGNTSRGILHILWGWSFKHLYPVNRVLPESALGRLRPFQNHSILTTVQLIAGMVWLIKNAGSTQNISLFAPPTPNPHPYHRLDAGVGLYSTLYTLKVIPARDEWVHILNSVQYKQYSTVQYSTNSTVYETLGSVLRTLLLHTVKSDVLIVNWQFIGLTLLETQKR